MEERNMKTKENNKKTNAKTYLQAKKQNTPKEDKGVQIMRYVKKGKKRKEKEREKEKERTSYTNKNQRTNQKELSQRNGYIDKYTCWSTDGLSFHSRLGQKACPETTQPHVERRAATSCSVTKRPKREANQSRPTFSIDRNERTYTSTSPHAFMTCTQTTSVLCFTKITWSKGTYRCALQSE